MHPAAFKFILFLAPILIFDPSNSANAMTLSDKEEIVFAGKITEEAVNEFIAKNQTNEFSELVIFSPGGDIESGIRFGNWVKDRNLNVRVRNLCMSACANYIFAAGKEKFIEKNAIVIWHGSMEQKNIRDDLNRFDAVLKRSLENAEGLNADDRAILMEADFYIKTKRLREMQAKFYSRIHVQEYITRLGQEPKRYQQDGWTASIKLMAAMGIGNVHADESYGTKKYINRNGFAAWMSGGTPIGFNIDENGTIFPNE